MGATEPARARSMMDFAVQPVSHSATAFWTASSASVAGYNVYRSPVPGGPYPRLNSSLVTAPTYDNAVLASLTYFYTGRSSELYRPNFRFVP
jgi:hypothetical protein